LRGRLFSENRPGLLLFLKALFPMAL